MDASKALHKRSANWAEGERVYAMQLILDKYSLIQSKFRGASNGAREKEKIWHEIADQLNASGQASCPRTAAEVKKMFGNMKTRAKEKFDANTKTGGGPQAKLSPTEDLIICHLLSNNSSQLKGLDSGIDSFASCSENVSSEDFSLTLTSNTPVHVQEVHEGINIIDSNNTCSYASAINTCSYDLVMEAEVGCSGDGKSLKNATEEKKTNSIKKTAKRYRDDKENELYELEKKKIISEINMIQQKTVQNQELFMSPPLWGRHCFCHVRLSVCHTSFPHDNWSTI